MIRRFLQVQPSELKFPFELNKICACSIQLTNKTDEDVAFKVKTTHPKKYCVRPNLGIISPGSKCVVEVIMQPQMAAPCGVLQKDKFLVQSMIAPGEHFRDVTSEMFKKEVGNDPQEHKLRVVFVNANPPSPIPEASEEESSSEASELENSHLLSCRGLLFNSASGTEAQSENKLEEVAEAASEYHGRFSEESLSAREPEKETSLIFEALNHRESNAEDWAMISKLTEEKSMAISQCHKLQQEWDTMRRQAQRSNHDSSTLCILFVVIFLGFLLGYMVG